jgi:acetyltransferase
MSSSLDAIFKPRSIAVVGATPRRGSIGREILNNLFAYDFSGMIFPVNPRYEYIHSTKAYPTVLSITDPVDLAVIVVPKEYVLQAVEDCGRKGVGGLVIISAGFREVGEEGLKRELAVIEVAEKYGMRMIGPNCMGVISSTPDSRMNATYSPGTPPSGDIAFMTQSGALGVAILLATQKLGLGFSYFASVGNKADVSAADLLEYWEDDPHTNVIALYLESFGDPHRFTNLSKRVSRKKPIVAVKAGATAAGARAASSHTGSMAGLEVAADALLNQCGVIRVSRIDEMIDVVSGFSKAPLPNGNRLCILTNAGGPAIMAADSMEGSGLEMATPADETRKAVEALLPPEASAANPIDMISGAGPDEFEKVLGLVLQDENVDICIAIFVPPLIIEPMGVMRRITRIGRQHDKPVYSVLMAEEQDFDRIPQEIEDAVPFYRFPEPAVRVASEMNKYRIWREKPAGEINHFEGDFDRARAIIDARREAGGGYLTPEDAYAVLEAVGFPVCRHASFGLDDDVTKMGKAAGCPCVLKVTGEKIVHKSDVGGVIIGIKDEKELLAARAQMEKRLREAGVWDNVEGFFVQEMAAPGKEVILGVTEDPTFGPLIMFGMGGRYVEIVRDVAFRVMPVTDVDAHDMVRSIKSFPLLEGVRGEERVDIEFVEESVQRLAQLVEAVDGIAELDMNPVIVTTDREGCRVVDARIRVASTARAQSVRVT